MDDLTALWYNSRFRAAEADAALDVAHQQVKLLNWGSARKFGIINRANRHLLLFEHAAPAPEYLPDGDHNSGWPTIDWFLQLLRPADQQFVGESLEKVHQFLESLPPDDYPNYRLSFDLCCDNQPSHAHRLLMHFRYLAPVPQFPEGLCLFWAYSIDSAQLHSPPLRAFGRLPGLEPVLFRRGEGNYPSFSDKRRPMLELLRQGRSVKQIAQLVGCSEATVSNTLVYLRQHVYVANNPQLVYYFSCFYGY